MPFASHREWMLLAYDPRKPKFLGAELQHAQESESENSCYVEVTEPLQVAYQLWSGAAFGCKEYCPIQLLSIIYLFSHFTSFCYKKLAVLIIRGLPRSFRKQFFIASTVNQWANILYFTTSSFCSQNSFEVKGDPSSNQELVPSVARISRQKEVCLTTSRLMFTLL